MMEKKDAILFCPLNWGLGHATRMVPLIHKYKEVGHKIVIAANGSAFNFLKLEFPDAHFENFAGIKVRYFKKPFFILGVLLQMPLFLGQIIFEWFYVAGLVRKYNPMLIISDNRYGIRSSKTRSVLVTHQLFIELPNALKLGQTMLHKFTGFLLQQFDEIWVPDFQAKELSLSGSLSHGKITYQHVKYIGPLSRFSVINKDKPVVTEIKFDVLILISGPEPHRAIYETEMEDKFRKSGKRVLMLCGKPNTEMLPFDKVMMNYANGIIKLDHLPTSTLFHFIKTTEKIYARCGYSSIMDFELLKKNVVWSPTPGQTEQEYLYEWMNRNKVEKHT